MVNDKQAASPQERAKRLLDLRSALRLSRPQFAHKTGIPVGTLQNWEEVRQKGLGERGAKRIVDGLQVLGITDCRVEWLLYGIGKEPSILQLTHLMQGNGPHSLLEENAITQELSTFYQCNPSAIDTVITDESMLPCFQPSDHVAGQRYFEKEITDAIGLPCIVQLYESSQILVRILEPGSQPGHYTLRCTNPTKAKKQAVLKDVKLLSVAPVLWIRKKRQRQQ